MSTTVRSEPGTANPPLMRWRPPRRPAPHRNGSTVSTELVIDATLGHRNGCRAALALTGCLPEQHFLSSSYVHRTPLDSLSAAGRVAWL
jgi:hypothetical protein